VSEQQNVQFLGQRSSGESKFNQAASGMGQQHFYVIISLFSLLSQRLFRMCASSTKAIQYYN